MDNLQQNQGTQPTGQQSPVALPSQPNTSNSYAGNQGQRQANYGQQPNYSQPQSQPNYTQPQQPRPNYSQPQPNYGQAKPNYGQPGQGQYAAGNAQYAQQPQQPVYVNHKSKILAGILGILFGSLGIHNFYLGFYGKAAGQLALTVLLGWVFGLGALAAEIWGLVEGILILSSHYGSKWHRDAKGVELAD
ncbi:TM2 domain-containing protein [Bifidobacterium sp. ESL0790]|uniref:TM2 domain-containing protein n=1 Tax=Bifidobacterium sp. ESL0790 TaxID=2983233 RepID=UPI0023F6B33C|nr:TM2 domain-containing protein [Bifidobacterium sp. ESL0790]WEV72194.1 NINE protein [Bifidobacterium sp. ESL0790]